MARTDLEPRTDVDGDGGGSRRWVWITAAVLAVPLLAGAWWLVRPALVDDRVDTAFPVSIDDAEGASTDGGADDGAAPAPTEAAAQEPAADEPTSGEAEQPTEEAEPAAPAGPQLLGRGSFVGLDDHDATGDAALFEQPDGSHVVRLEEIDVDNGPGLELYVVSGRDQTRPGDGLFVAPLQGNQGNQTYELPDDFTPPEEVTVLIWCEPFSTAIGGATLD